MLFIGICGASGSGKSTLAEELIKELGVPCTVINQDAYYKNNCHLTFEQRTKLNYDEPYIFDHDTLYDDVESLLSGKPIVKKAYDFAEHKPSISGEIICPTDVLIVEGIHAFYDKRLCDQMYIKLYLSVEPDVCLLRRISRDIKERGRAIDNIADQYMATVKPMYDKYIKHYVKEADVIVAHGGKNARIVEILAGYLRDKLLSEMAK